MIWHQSTGIFPICRRPWSMAADRYSIGHSMIDTRDIRGSVTMLSKSYRDDSHNHSAVQPDAENGAFSHGWTDGMTAYASTGCHRVIVFPCGVLPVPTYSSLRFLR